MDNERRVTPVRRLISLTSDTNALLKETADGIADFNRLHKENEKLRIELRKEVHRAFQIKQMTMKSSATRLWAFLFETNAEWPASNRPRF